MAYIFDIDGTLADCSHRLHFIQQEKPDWDAFYKDCVNDKPILPVVELAQVLKDSYQDLIFVTGRPTKYANETIEWLCNTLETDYIKLYMRDDGDHRPDYVIKKEIYEKYLTDYCIDGVFEDRKQCVDMWRSLGLTCYQVADGNY